MNLIQKTGIWLEKLKFWLHEWWLFWLFLILVFSPCLMRYILSLTSIILPQNLNSFYGILLQLTGTITIVIGIYKKVKLFHDLNPLKDLCDYFSRFPSRSKHRVLELSGSLIGKGSTSGTITKSMKPDKNYEDIIKYIDEQVEQIMQEISSTRNELYQQIKRTKQLNEQLDSQIKAVEKKIETNSTLNAGLELFGAGCIALGLIYSIL